MKDMTRMEKKQNNLFNLNANVTQSPAVDPSPTMPTQNLDLRKSFGTNWNKSNTSVLFEWVTIAAYNIRCLELAIIHYRRKIRLNTILGLVLSTLSGTIATAQAGFPNTLTANLPTVLNSFFVVMSFTIAIMTGYIKIYQIQENLESNIKAKQEWISFSADIASELQLPVELRKDALWLIIKNKSIYLDLLKTNLEIPPYINKQVQIDLKAPPEFASLDVSSLPRILMDIATNEMRDLNSNEDKISHTVQKQLTHLITQPPNSQIWKNTTKLKSIVETNNSHQLEEEFENELVNQAQKTNEPSLGSVKSDHQVVTMDMGSTPIHPRLEVQQV